MPRITSRNQFIEWLSDHAPNKVVQRAIDRGKVTIHGLFKGGWVVEVEYNGKSYVVGVKPRLGKEAVCGLLKRIPVEDYIGGEDWLAKGDNDGKSSTREEQ